MILQAITCDICGAEKHQTNHWFIAYEESGELRISGWNSPRLLCQGTKHLCGERCLHKMIDKFLSELMNKSSHSTTEDKPAADSAPAVQAEQGGPVSNPQRLSEYERREPETVPELHSAGGRRTE